jgi:biopolymer transport protein ExbB
MNLNPLHIWASMSLLSKLIASVLLVFATVSIAVVVERVIAFIRAKSETSKFARAAAPLIEAWDFDRLATTADAHKRSPLARLVAPVVRKFAKGVDDDGGLSPVEIAKRESSRQLEAIGADLRRGFSALASIGSVAPFVGLLGTVVGIISAFQGIAASGSGGLGSVSAGIAEALVETALGLMVAIPAVLFYNFLSARVNGLEAVLARSAGELVDQLENEHGRRTDSVGQKKAA